MFKTLFQCSMLLAMAGSLIMFIATPQSSSQFVKRMLHEYSMQGGDTLASGFSRDSNIVMPAGYSHDRAFPYSVSLMGLEDYYHYVPYFGTLIR